MAAGFAVGAWWLVRRGRARGLAANRLIDLTIIMVISGLVGGRLLYAMTHWNQFQVNPWRIFWPVQADGTLGMQGFVYYGGIMLAIPIAAVVVRRWQLPPLKALDAGAPALALGTAIGRLGCFLNGCCFGRPTDGPFGVVFPEGSQAGNLFTGVAIHPTQLYMVADNLVLVGLLLLIDRKWGGFDGVVIGTYLMLTGLTRSYEDVFRYYEGSMRLLDLGGLSITVNHVLGAVLLVVGGLLIARSRSRIPDTQV